MPRIKTVREPKGTKSALKVKRHVASKLLELRRDHGMTMKEVARKSGISQAFICQIENAQSAPTVVTLVRLSKVFKVPASYWLDGF